MNYLSAFDSHLKPEVLSYSNQHPDLALENIREVIGCHGLILNPSSWDSSQESAMSLWSRMRVKSMWEYIKSQLHNDLKVNFVITSLWVQISFCYPAEFVSIINCHSNRNNSKYSFWPNWSSTFGLNASGWLRRFLEKNFRKLEICWNFTFITIIFNLYYLTLRY